MTSLSRRTFAQLSALTLAASRVPSFAQSATALPTAKPVGFAAVGLGVISDIFMRACVQTPSVKVAGLVTGHPADKGSRYAAQYGLPATSVYTYETFDRIRDNPDIEAVYIGLPNSMHAEFTIRAAQAGKHVLCEKPMAISSAECRRMIDACKQANVRLMIAYRVHYDPMWQQIRTLARSGAIGQIRGFQGGFYGIKEGVDWRLDRKLSGGGSLMDLGIYPLNAARWFAGEEPVGYTAQVTTMDHSGKFSSVEEAIEFTVKFPSGMLASAGSSYGEHGPSFLNVYGTQGELRIEPAFGYDGLKYSGTTTTGPVGASNTGRNPYEFVYEADHFAHCVRNNRTPDTAGEEGLADLLAMEAIYRAAGAPIA